MANERLDERKVETYAHTLFEAALSEDRVFENLEPLQAEAFATPEFDALLTTMAKQGDLSVLPKVLEVYRELMEGNREAVGAHEESADIPHLDVREMASNPDVVGVHVTTAVPLDDELRALITAKCEADLEQRVFLIEHVDPSIIGGIVLSARGRRADASVRMQLENARKVMTQDSTRTEV